LAPVPGAAKAGHDDGVDHSRVDIAYSLRIRESMLLTNFKYDESLKIKYFLFHKLFLRHLAELSSVGYTRQNRFSTSSLKKSSHM
jgi:hypothetical protein